MGLYRVIVETIILVIILMIILFTYFQYKDNTIHNDKKYNLFYEIKMWLSYVVMVLLLLDGIMVWF